MDGEVLAGCEFRASDDGRTLTGIVMRYGTPAADRRETFLAGAFAPLPTVPLVLGHDDSAVLAKGGDYVLEDSPVELRVRVALGEHSAVPKLVRSGALAGFSVKFWPVSEHRDAGGVRVIERATLGHVGLVGAPSYPASTAEVRALDDARWRRCAAWML